MMDGMGIWMRCDTVGRGTMGVVVADESQPLGRVGQNERTADIPHRDSERITTFVSTPAEGSMPVAIPFA
jgi:hypothetical protein